MLPTLEKTISVVITATLITSHSHLAFAATTNINSPTSSTQTVSSGNSTLNVNAGGSIDTAGADNGVNVNSWNWTVNVDADAGQGITTDTGYAVRVNGNAGLTGTLNVNSGVVSSNQDAVLFNQETASLFYNNVNVSEGASILAGQTAITHLGAYDYLTMGSEPELFNITNAGTISGQTAIDATHIELHLINSGAIVGNITSTEARIVNSGTITGSITGTGTNHDEVGDVTINNTGTIYRRY